MTSSLNPFSPPWYVMTHLPRPRPRLILVKKGALLKDKIALYRRKYKIYWHILSTFWKYPFLVDIFQHLLLHLTPDTFAKQLHCTAPQSNWWGKMISLKIKRWSSWADVSSCPQGASLPFPSCATAPNTTPAYIQKAGDAGDISPPICLDFPPNFRLSTRNPLS